MEDPQEESPPRTIPLKDQSEGALPEHLHTQWQSLPSPDSPSQVGGRLQKFWPMWQEMGASHWVVSVLRWGYNLEFHQKPPLTLVPNVPSDRNYAPKNALIQEQFDILLSKGAIEEVHAPFGPGFYSLLFVRPKPNGTW